MLRLIRLLFLARSIWAVLGAFAVGAGLIWLAGFDPIEAYSALLHGAFLDYYGFATTLIKTSPMLLAGLAVAFPLRAGLFNIGAEGQIYLGGLFATVTALSLPAMPGWLGILLCSLAGMLGGGLWGLIPGYLKAVRGVNEVLVTLLLNYVAINLVSYAVSGPLMEPGAPYPFSPEIRQSFLLPRVLPGTNVHLGVALALAVAILIFFIFRRTTFGFSLATVGLSPGAALYAGMSVRWHVMLSLACGGALAGLAGAYEILGLKYRLFHLFSAGYGYDGIVVALLAEGHPLLIAVAAVFLGGLRSGANVMQRSVGVPTAVIEVIQGLVVIFVAASLATRFDLRSWTKLLGRRRQTKTIITQRDNG